MLTSSFCCFWGVTVEAERRLWQGGILNWDDFLREGGRVLSARKADNVKFQIDEARRALEAGFLDYFLKRLPAEHRVRVLAHTKGNDGYFDIETDGLRASARVTTIALATSAGVRVFVDGRDMAEFLTALRPLSLLVSYNGARFDVPFIERRFRMRLPPAHLDLYPVLRSMGYMGGLKACERHFDIVRPAGGARDGQDAVLLWRRWRETGDASALQSLIQYNAQDACSLQRIARDVYARSMASHPLRETLRPFRSLTTEKPQHMVG
jgi:uncharacterized protein YprB with RNaseH-like and TPR domain